MGLETKFAAECDVPLRLEGDALVSGYASLFGVVDSGGDIVAPGAYCDGLARIATEGGRVRMLWQHDPSCVIGVWDEVREDAKGLFVRGRLLPDVAQGREAAALVRAGALDGLSIGYTVKRAVRNEAGHRVLKELDLWEVSLVTFPMLSSARVGAKSQSDRTLVRLLQAARRDLAHG
ncbi:HK97 family phage prohead protease [Jannaschia sp. LMIT008]|uniref:HK97 family phage prohead protease n=1 Tax=Jannaschia maritima TaxID=3032585 RepID=UPI0028127C22|nr:HK97 family phage prohead protease [Jannaschia sp. LMIT008]